MEITFENVSKIVEQVNKQALQAKDNLFSANHRGEMIRQYGYTQAMDIKIEELI
jgi:hypothetical protein